MNGASATRLHALAVSEGAEVAARQKPLPRTIKIVVIRSSRVVKSMLGACKTRVGRTRATANRCNCLVQELPGLGAIQSPNPSGLNNAGIEVAEIDAHSAPGATDWLPVRDAATVGAAKVPEVFVSPSVMSQSPLARDNSHLASVVVAPEPTVAATD